MNRYPYFTRQSQNQAHQRQLALSEIIEERERKLQETEKQRYKHFLKWKSGRNLSNSIIDTYFSNQVVNGKFKDPITLQPIKEEEGILIGHHIFQSETVKKYIITEAREKNISLRIPGSVDEDEFIITFLGTNPQNPMTRHSLSQLDAKLIYEYLYSGTTMPYDEHITRKYKTRHTTANASGKKHRKKTKKYKKKKRKSKKNKNKS
tara:strand:+ start:518 stop:1135 length:618 start_codon:yes stop_codon:yes gene_type:complete